MDMCLKEKVGCRFTFSKWCGEGDFNEAMRLGKGLGFPAEISHRALSLNYRQFQFHLFLPHTTQM